MSRNSNAVFANVASAAAWKYCTPEAGVATDIEYFPHQMPQKIPGEKGSDEVGGSRFLRANG